MFTVLPWFCYVFWRTESVWIVVNQSILRCALLPFEVELFVDW